MKKQMSMVGLGAAVVLCAGTGMADEAKAETWADRIALKGDFRFRYENIDKEGSDTRVRNRGRLRLGLSGVVNDEMKVHVRLASGSDDPVSSNQTFGDGWSTKNYGLDQAYVDWHPASVEGLSVYAGKMSKPWVCVKDLVWDGDLNPEGVSLQYTMAAGEAVTLRAQGGYFFIEERKADSDTGMYSAQLVADVDGDAVDVMLGGGVFMYDNMNGFATVFDAEDGFGNTTLEAEDGTLLYVNEYEVAEAMASVSFKAGVPVKVYGDYIVNMDAPSGSDTGYLAGVTVGKAKKAGSWQLDYNYRDLESDATVGAYSDSDFGGGGTGAKGSKGQIKYQLSKNLQLAVSHFVNTLGDEKDYNRTQIDLVAKF